MKRKQLMKFFIAGIVAAMWTLVGCDDRKSTKRASSPPAFPENATGAPGWGQPATSAGTAAASPGAGQPSLEEDIATVWEATMGQRKPGDPIIAKMTLDVRKDKTFTMTNFMPDARDPAKSITNKSEGRWHLEPDYLVLDFERSLDGRPIPPEKKQVKLWASGSVEGHFFTDLSFDPNRAEGHFARKSK